jgi:hypothetical protein
LSATSSHSLPNDDDVYKEPHYPHYEYDIQAEDDLDDYNEVVAYQEEVYDERKWK